MSPESQQIVDRAESIISNYPTLDEALACLDCEIIFKRAEKGKCPICSSQSLWNISTFLS
jgi:rubrerythrin